MYSIKTWKWSTGEPYYKSARQKQENSRTAQNSISSEPSYDTQVNAINQSLENDPFFNQDNELINITNTTFSRNQNPNGNRREDLDTKIANRQLISQRGVNPFLQTSYVNDVVARDMFLKPINTTTETSNKESSDN